MPATIERYFVALDETKDICERLDLLQKYNCQRNAIDLVSIEKRQKRNTGKIRLGAGRPGYIFISRWIRSRRHRSISRIASKISQPLKILAMCGRNEELYKKSLKMYGQQRIFVFFHNRLYDGDGRIHERRRFSCGQTRRLNHYL
jgi:hypothetical protein